jgi:hypothetical protein
VHRRPADAGAATRDEDDAIFRSSHGVVLPAGDITLPSASKGRPVGMAG